ncbi:uncharacterized protein BCR38DRAFT_413199 [Pseudomassariella vexata]|uniref:Transcription factor domain-containing protein n=1 Tax=Pseudomassariella vexata TaxID=1141098 RepID=A0A1Y2DIA2_9PEZI|nr:uncharacterized protein BCR38DRAFT_413199 [Pseudomassariella vexata]ORY58884.1 hypothetical protein BCR38DRAFT_413199 [Pseudomassariella vexata]
MLLACGWYHPSVIDDVVLLSCDCSCSRRGQECRPSSSVRKRNLRKPPLASRPSQLEEKLEDLVTLLRSQQTLTRQPSGPPAESAAQPHDLGVPSSIGYTNYPSDHHYVSSYQVEKCFEPPIANTRCHVPSVQTPSTMVVSSTSHPSPNSISTSGSQETELTPAEAEEVLNTFHHQYLRFLPFIYIPPEMTAQRLQDERLFLWLNIRAVCCRSLTQVNRLGHNIREILARRVFVDLERTCCWAFWYTSGANSLVSDIRLDRLREATGSSCLQSPQLHHKPPPKTQNHEERRAILACFIISSAFLRVDVVRCGPQLDECVQSLAEQPEYAGDEFLVAIARIKLIVQEVSRISSSLRARLEQLKNSLGPALVQDKAIMSHFHHAESCINEVAAFHPLPITMPVSLHATNPPPFPVPSTNNIRSQPISQYLSKPIDMPRLEVLQACLDAVQLSIANFLSFGLHEYVTMPFAIFTHWNHAIHVLYRLSLLEAPDWDRAAVRQALDVTAVLNEVAYRMAQVPCAIHIVVGERDRDLFSRGATALRATATRWGAALGHVPGENDAIGNPGGENSLDSLGEEVTQEEPTIVDFGDDAWLTDLFGMWKDNQM